MVQWKWTPSEQQALIVSMQHFGACTCQPPRHGGLKTVCEGHRFLSETDRRVDRPMHMLYVRRTRQEWIDSEWMGNQPPRDEPTQPVLPEAVKQASEPTEPDPPDTLPW